MIPARRRAAREADLHLAIRPGTNVALLNALLREIIANGWIDSAYVTAHTVGFDQLKKTVLARPTEWVAEICGVPVGQIHEAAFLIGTSDRLISFVLQGVYQSNQATAAAVQVNNLHLLHAMIGRPGCGRTGSRQRRTLARPGPMGTSRASATGTIRLTSSSWPSSGTSIP